MSEIMSFHAVPVGAVNMPLMNVSALVEDDDDRLADISFSGGSLSTAITYLVDLGLNLIDIPLSEDVDSDEIFGRTMTVVESAMIYKIIARIEEDSEAGIEIADDMLNVFIEAIEEISGQTCDIVIIW